MRAKRIFGHLVSLVGLVCLFLGMCSSTALGYTSVDSDIVVDKHQLTELGTISGDGHTLSSMLVCRVFRDADNEYDTDDYPGFAGLLEIDFHFRVDAPGSIQEYSKDPV